MSLSRLFPRPVLFGVAVLFAATTVLYTALWVAAMMPSGRPITVELAFDTGYSAADRASVVTSVWDDGPAQKSGLVRGDRIVAVDGVPVIDDDTVNNVWRQHQPGDVVRLLVVHPGADSPVLIRARFRLRQADLLAGPVGQLIRAASPLPFVLVGLVVLFLRLDDRNVWLLALLCASFTTTKANLVSLDGTAMALRPFALAYQSVFLGLIGPLFYTFFAVFPSQSPADRRVPALKWIALAIGVCLGLSGVREGSITLPPPLAVQLGRAASQQIAVACLLGFFVLGLVSLTVHFFSTADVQARRKMRVIYWGTAIGVLPGLTQAWFNNFAGYRSPPWLATVVPLFGVLFPLSFAYAIFRYRVLDIPVLLRQSARYLLVQRGFTILLSLASVAVTLLFAFTVARYLQPLMPSSQPLVVVLATLFGTALLWSGMRVHAQVSDRIDRAFFRRAYDARLILEDLADASRRVTDRLELAELLHRHLGDALQSNTLVVYLGEEPGRLQAVSGEVPPGLHAIPANVAMVRELEARGAPWQVAGREDQAAMAEIGPLAPECLVPILGRSGALLGLIVLGVRRSEEPYSREDLRLLASVAGQAGTALENIRLAQEIAERMERERRAAREMEIAKEVQARLLPSVPPVLASADVAAECVQARAVGGDCYDFLDLGTNHVGLMLADVSGKGIHAALVMANLVAHLRSQFGLAPADPECALQRVNRLVYGSTATQHYATLFFGAFDDARRTLTYVNCGHNPPVLRRASGGVERLMPTAPVIGLFDERDWTCSVGEVQLHAGDVLAVFSDGVTEAQAITGDGTSDQDCDEFGEERFLSELDRLGGLPVDVMVREILATVQEFCAGQPSDDLTLMITRVR